MMGFGLLMMALVLGLPVLLIAAILIWVLSLKSQRSWPKFSPQTPTSLMKPEARNCAHCGQSLQAEWTHCPNCGAPI